MLVGKTPARGGKLIKIPARHTGRTCPECGFRHAYNRENQARLGCRHRGVADNADVAGAKNVFTAGQAALNACGGHGARGRPVKQEPAGDQRPAFASVSAGTP
ncbi:MAG: transposase [Deltaproteobacteria bacterium]|nr:transposase [Deltaproteobacteria bacterium]